MMRARHLLTALSFVLAVSACGNAIAPRAPAAPPAPASKTTENLDPLFEQLALLATGAAPDEAELQRLHRVSSAGIGAVLDDLVASPRFGAQMATVLLRPGPWTEVPVTFRPYVLKHTEKKGEPTVYFLREPCAASKAVRVRPWWSPKDEVNVCPDSYQEKRFEFDPKKRVWCDSTYQIVPLAPGESACGCGPNLFRCFRDFEHSEQVRRSLIRENVDTFDHVVRSDLPIDRIFTQRETVRNKDVEAMYLREAIESGAPVELLLRHMESDWPVAAGKLAPRDEKKPGRHAGLLTAASTAWGQSLRERMMLYQHVMWCTSVKSVDVTAADIFKAGTADLREGTGWKDLASKPICTNCHARMDYAMEFFLGFGDWRVRQHYDAHEQLGGAGPLYLANIQDARGNAERSPKGFAEAAIRQPEFAQCMVERVAKHVLSHRVGPKDTEALRAAFSRRSSIKDLMRAALERYIVVDADVHGTDARPTVPAGASPGDRPLALSGPLRKAVETRCLGCHGSGDDGVPAFDVDHLPPPMLRKMLREVAFKSMPQGAPFAEAERRDFVASVVDVLWTDVRARETARGYFVDWMRALPVHQADATTQLVRSSAGGSRGDGESGWAWPTELYEDSAAPDLFQLTPTYATSVMLDALAACREAKQVGPALDACLERATAPEPLIRRPRRR